MKFYKTLVFIVVFTFCSSVMGDESEIVVKFRETVNKVLSNIESRIFNKDVKPDPVVVPVKCECNGTGFITHGDGHKTPCPNYPACTKKDGQIGPKEAELPSEPTNAYIVMYSSPTCLNCKIWSDNMWKPLTNSGWKLKKDDKSTKYSRFPTFEVWVRGKKEIVVGYLSSDILNNIVKKHNK